MTTKILVPEEWEKLSPQEKELAKSWIKSILDADKYTENLIELLSSQAQSNNDFLTQFQESDEQEIVEIFSNAAPSTPETPGVIGIMSIKPSDSLKNFLQKRLRNFCVKHPEHPKCK